MARVTTVLARTAGVLALVTAMAVPSGCGTTVRDQQDESVSGPEWGTWLRSGIGAASAETPARLTRIDADERDEFDRISITFDGPLPGYRVGYASRGSGLLTILLRHVSTAPPRALDVGLPAVAAVHPDAPAGGDARTTVTIASRNRLPFRIGFSLDSFYVDVAHPGEGAGLG